MKLYRIGRGQYIKDLSGTGASLYGGRWNSKGTFILYTAGSSSLALLESVVHMNKVAGSDYHLICLELPVMPFEIISADDLPANWQQNPPPDYLKRFGNEFVVRNEKIALQVPSVIMPLEYNYLLNPFHRDYNKIEIAFIQPLPIDSRLLP